MLLLTQRKNVNMLYVLMYLCCKRTTSVEWNRWFMFRFLQYAPTYRLLQADPSQSGLWSCDKDTLFDVCVCVSTRCVRVLGCSFSSGLGIMASSFFLFFSSSFALQVAPTIWKQALKTRPSLSHQNGMKIYPHIVLSLLLTSAADYKQR